MNEWSQPNSSQSTMRLEVARRRIGSFAKRFGLAHLYLAQHAAFPLALTPDLLYRLWANFSRTLSGERLNIPWVAVSDLLLSGLCEEVGQELYEMDSVIRNEMLSDLQYTFGDQRIRELADFLLVYIRQQIVSSDLYVRDFALSQRWTALAYIRPGDAARELALALRLSMEQNDRAEQIRIRDLVETLAQPLAEYHPLLMFIGNVTNIVDTEVQGEDLLLPGTSEKNDVTWDEEMRLEAPEQGQQAYEEDKSQSAATASMQPQSKPSETGITVHNLKHHLAEHYQSLYAYLQLRAKRYLGPLGTDAFEVDQVVGYVVEQLTRLQILGTGNNSSKTVLDDLTNAQLFAFLNRIVRNRANDRLLKHRAHTSTLSDLEQQGSEEEEEELIPIDELVESLWGTSLSARPEEIAIEAASQESLRRLLKDSIKQLKSAPKQLQAIMYELHEFGMDDLVQELSEELGVSLETVPPANLSQHKDHAHKKLRRLLQHSSTNLAVIIAMFLAEYEAEFTGSQMYRVELKTLAQGDLTEGEVRRGLQHLAAIGLINWQGEEIVLLSSEQRKNLARFYEEGE